MEESVLRLLILGILIWVLGSNLATTNKPINTTVDQQTNQENLNQDVKKYESSVVTVVGYKTDQSKSNSQNPLSDFLSFPYFSGFYMTMGTGFLISSDGTILTNKHVVDDISANYKVTLNNGQRYNVVSIYRDPNNDAAVLKINPNSGDNLTPINLGDSSKIKNGDAVATIGTDPINYQQDVKVGQVLGLGYQVIADNPYQNEREKLNNVIQTDLNLVPGNSGSPLINSDGQVVGINTATASTFNNVSFAIPINPVKQFVSTIGQ